MIVSMAEWWRNFKLKTRAWYKQVMKPFGSFLGKLGITPNVLTFIGGFFAIATATMYSFQGRIGSFDYWWLLGFLLMIVTGFIDMLDGSVARATGTDSLFGKVFDPVMDRFAEFCFLIGIAIGNYSYEPLTTTFLVTIPVGAWCLFGFAGMIFASYARARGESVVKLNAESVGLMERREKLALLYLGNLLFYWFEISLVIAIFLVGLLSFITTIQRMVYINKAMKEFEMENNNKEEKTLYDQNKTLTTENQH
jgi:archaetidylinositol phosphate synthase